MITLLISEASKLWSSSLCSLQNTQTIQNQT